MERDVQEKKVKGMKLNMVNIQMEKEDQEKKEMDMKLNM